jgi:hypothetical protein
MAQVDATSMTTTANNSTVNRSNSRTISINGLGNVNIVKLLSTLVYISDSINREINDASFNNKTDITKEIPVLVSSGYDVVGMIKFLCCKGYIIRPLTVTKEPSKDDTSQPIVYKPNTYTSQNISISPNDNYKNNYYMVIDWNYNQTGINPDGYNPGTYTIDFATSSL